MKEFHFSYIQRKKMPLVLSFLSTFLLSMIGNGFAYFNLFPHHDSLNHALYFAGNWEISLGRVLLPIYGKIRGDSLMPWLIGILSIIFISLSVFLIAELFCIKNPILFFLLAGFMSVNYTIIEVCGTFSYVLDSYMLSLLFVCIGVYTTYKMEGGIGCIVGGIFFFLSLGLYQSFITVALILFIGLTIEKIIYQKVTLKCLMAAWLRWGIALGIGAVLYFVGYKVTLLYADISPANSYNSISKLSGMTFTELIQQIKNGYTFFGEIFFEESIWNEYWIKNINIVLIFALILFLFLDLIREKNIIVKMAISIMAIIIFPLISLLMCILMDYSRIYFAPSYGIFFVYLYCLMFITKSINSLTEKFRSKLTVTHILKIIHTIILFLCCLILINFIKYANGAYTLQKFTYDRTLSIATRMIYQMDNTEGYIPGETDVIVVGNLNSNNNIENLNTFNKYSVLSGYQKTSITYTQTLGSFFKLLGEPISIVTDSELLEYYTQLDIIQQMPSFPQIGYCQMVDNKLIIKLSNII